MPIPESARAMGARPAWMGYVGVDDVDGYATRVKAARGTVHRPPEDIPGIGRFAVVADPDGAAFILFKGTSGEAPTPAAQGTPGHIGWHELHATDREGAFAFYSSLFGWTKTEAMDMGPMGVYQMFATGGATVGGMMTKAPEMPVPCWLYYFNVDAIDAAVTRVTAGRRQGAERPARGTGRRLDRPVSRSARRDVRDRWTEALTSRGRAGPAADSTAVQTTEADVASLHVGLAEGAADRCR